MIQEELANAADQVVGIGQVIDLPSPTIAQLFAQGGLTIMIVITLLLIGLLVAAWKAPRWVREIGISALVVSIFSALLGLAHALDAVQMAGDVSSSIVAGGLKCCLIPIIYGLIIYFISLVIRVIQKPRI
jgi:hypothetical protein